MRNKTWFLLHNNAPGHRAGLFKDVLAKNNATTLKHSPYSPNLVPADFYLSPQLKSALKGRRFWVLISPLRMRRKSWKGCQNMATRNVSDNFPVADRSVYLHKSLLCRKCSLNNCTLLYFSEIKWYWEHFEDTTYSKDVRRTLIVLLMQKETLPSRYV
jgi:hypothetical protein